MPLRALLLTAAFLLLASPLAAQDEVPEDAPESEGSKPLRVMPMGDSITVGIGSTHSAGYRLTFWNRMQEAGIRVNMVGGKANGPEGFDGRHQGYNGMTVYELSGIVAEKLDRYRPDVILLMVGTNDTVRDSFSLRAFQVNFDVMADRIVANEPGALVLVSSVPPNKYGRGQGAKLALNAFLRRFVEQRQAEGEDFHFVDGFAVLDDRRDMADTLHPNDGGYEKLGDAFADTLLALLGDDVAG